MANTITAGNGTNGGTAISSDNTGTLDIKTGSGAGTTAISINATQAVSIPGNLTVSGTFSAPGVGGNYALNAYTAPATWTKPATLRAVKVTVIGSGGSGGGAPGGGGGAGGAAIYYVPAPSIPGPQAITAGPGTNSFGALASATAGSNGGNTANGGAGGSGSGGTLNFTGQAGSNTRTGGSSILGEGGVTQTSTTASAGTGYGGGGAGAQPPSPGVPPTPGSAATSGSPGIVIVEEFY